MEEVGSVRVFFLLLTLLDIIVAELQHAPPQDTRTPLFKQMNLVTPNLPVSALASAFSVLHNSYYLKF